MAKKGKQRKNSRSPSLGRRVGTIPERKTLMVFCEGEETEPQYLRALKQTESIRTRAAVEIRIVTESSGYAPFSLVKEAVRSKKRADSEQGEVDEFWCVFDVEWPRNHPHLPDAKQMARDNSVHLAVSNPCFELWLALHFKACGQFLTTKQAEKLAISHGAVKDKQIVDAEGTVENRALACANARSLEKRHADNLTFFPKDNPSSSMYRLIESVEATPAPN